MSRKEELTLRKKNGFARLLHRAEYPRQGSKNPYRPLASLPLAREPPPRMFLSKTVLSLRFSPLSSLTPPQDGFLLMVFDLKRGLPSSSAPQKMDKSCTVVLWV
jgi:hypothetical protein